MKKLISPFLLLIVILLFALSCGTYTPAKVASHIVAVTLQGDTILVPIDRIRPNMYHSYYPVYSSYNYYRPYYGQNNYQFRYSDNRGFKSSGGGNKSDGEVKINPKPINTTPDIVGRPSSAVLMKPKK
jgi:hypothetical protein|tara:strand:+ start:29 stop:412 length:384 start_codon:yes stop_codon:yes gene_type:complete